MRKDLRRIRGEAMQRMGHVTKFTANSWLVLSSNYRDVYLVTEEPKWDEMAEAGQVGVLYECTCKDFAKGFLCKHIYAACGNRIKVA